MILAADIGGTNCRLALKEGSGILRTRRVPTALLHSPEDLIALLRDFLEGASPRAMALSLAGPVTSAGGGITATGLAIPREKLEGAFPHTPLSLLNDLEAFALGMGEGVLLKPGRLEERGARGLLVPGTGLGEALVLEGRPFTGEGGHQDLAPGTGEERDLAAWLEKAYGGHVSLERALSGPGLRNLWAFYRSLPPEEGLAEVPSPEEILPAALGGDPLCSKVLDSFLALLGAEAGNLALRSLTRGGIFLGGSLLLSLPRERLLSGFLPRFLAKGRMAPLLEEIPLFLVREKEAALQGALGRAAAISR